VTQFLVESGADLAIRARLPGHYEQPDHYVECTAAAYARLFPGADNTTIQYLRSIAAPE
jgi:hypothetical protein